MHTANTLPEDTSAPAGLAPLLYFFFLAASPGSTLRVLDARSSLSSSSSGKEESFISKSFKKNQHRKPIY